MQKYQDPYRNLLETNDAAEDRKKSLPNLQRTMFLVLGTTFRYDLVETVLTASFSHSWLLSKSAGDLETPFESIRGRRQDWDTCGFLGSGHTFTNKRKLFTYSWILVIYQERWSDISVETLIEYCRMTKFHLFSSQDEEIVEASSCGLHGEVDANIIELNAYHDRAIFSRIFINLEESISRNKSWALI